MIRDVVQAGRLLAEVLRLQRWAGGEAVPAARLFGLMHGIESVLDQEDQPGISRDTQERVERILQAVDSSEQSTDGLAIKARLHQDGIDETDASIVMRLCLLQSRWTDAIDRLIAAKGSIFARLRVERSSETDWFGALHYMELVDVTDGLPQKMHSVFAPSVPRVGEIVEPEKGSRMKVVGVEHVVGRQEDALCRSPVFLVPHVLLKPTQEEIDDV